MAHLVVEEDAYGYTLEVSLVEPDATGRPGTTPIDLTGATLSIEIRKSDGTLLTGTPSVVGSAVNGVVAYTVTSTTFNEPGDYAAQIQASFSGPTRVYRSSRLNITVEPRV